MKLTAHFEDIAGEIGRRLRAAASELIVAVACFTDPELFDLLCRQAVRGVRVRLAVLDHGINQGSRGSGLNFDRLKALGGEVALIPSVGRDAIMDHKFCVIDSDTVIVGSYDWTCCAQQNDESILVIADDEAMAASYRAAFGDLLAKYALAAPTVDAKAVRQRLDALRNLVRLEDWEAIALQTRRLDVFRDALALEPLLDALTDRDSRAALAWLDHWLDRATALTEASSQQSAYLKLELRTLELHVTALSDEQAELSRQICAFDVSASRAYGDRMTRYLKLRAEKLRREATAAQRNAPGDADRAAEEAKQAEADYRSYRDADDAARAEPPPAPLPADQLAELKILYREASQRCHPDKVTEADRAQAEALFVQLQTAYRRNDLAGLRAIHAAAREGRFFVARSATLTEVEALGRAVLALRQQVQALEAGIRRLREGSTYRTLKDLTDWDAWFAEQRAALDSAISELQDELSAGARGD